MKISKTSLDAYLAEQDRIPSRRARVYQFLRGRGDAGATDEEIRAALGLSAVEKARRRRHELCQPKFCEGGIPVVMDSGRTRTNETGHEAIVWVVTPPGVVPEYRKDPVVEVTESEAELFLQWLEALSSIADRPCLDCDAHHKARAALEAEDD